MRRRRPLLFIGSPAATPVVRDRELASVDPERLSRLEWRQEGRWFRPWWSLWCESACIATLVPEGFARHHARFLTRTGEWHVRRRRWLGGFDVTRPDREEPVVHYVPAWFRGGRIERAAGATLRWKPGWFGRDGLVANEEDFTYLATRTRSRFLRNEGEVRVEQAGRALPDLLPLIALAWWMMHERARNSHAH